MVDGQMGMSTRDVSKGRENKSGISQPWKWTHFGGTSSTYKTPPTKSHYPGVGFKYLTIFHPMGEMIPIWRTNFFNGWMGGWDHQAGHPFIYPSTHPPGPGGGLPPQMLQGEILEEEESETGERRVARRGGKGARCEHLTFFSLSFFCWGGFWGWWDDGVRRWWEKTYMFVLRDFSDNPLRSFKTLRCDSFWMMSVFFKGLIILFNWQMLSGVLPLCPRPRPTGPALDIKNLHPDLVSRRCFWQLNPWQKREDFPRTSQI